MLKIIRFGVYYRGELLRSFATDQQATNYMHKLPWRYETFLCDVRGFEVTS